MKRKSKIIFWYYKHCVKNVRIWSFSSPYLVWMRQNTDHKNSKSRSEIKYLTLTLSYILLKTGQTCEHPKIFKVCLAIFQYYAWNG